MIRSRFLELVDLISTAFSRWLHCLLRGHRPADLLDAHGITIRMFCHDCERVFWEKP